MIISLIGAFDNGTLDAIYYIVYFFLKKVDLVLTV